MKSIKKILLIFIVNTFIMIVSWAVLILVQLCFRVFSPSEVLLSKVLPLYSFLIVLCCYAFYLAFDLSQYIFGEKWTKK